jgi:hypothetical protein
MYAQLKTFGLLLFAVAIAACGDDGNGTAGSGGTAGTGGTAGSGGAQTSTVTGTVYFYEEGYPAVAGATVEVYETSLSTTTDSQGNFTLEGVPHGNRFFITKAAGSWGLVDYWYVPDETPNGGAAELLVVRDAEVASWATAIGRPINDNHAMVDVIFQEGAQGGETATIDADSDPPFTFSGWDAVDQQTLIADVDGFGELVFPNINPPSGTVDAEVMPARCFIDESDGLRYPIFPKSVTIIYALCE